MEFNFSIYKGNSIYLRCFECMIRKTGIPRDAFLQKYNIAPSSFRRARDNEQSVGQSINLKLSSIFSKVMPSISEVEEFKDLFNVCYQAILYKNFNNYEFYENQLKTFKSRNLMFFPLVELLETFISVNKNLSNDKARKEIEKKIIALEDYEFFYTNEIAVIFKIIKLIYDEKPKINDYIEWIDNSFISYCLASKLSFNKNYEGSLYASTICQKSLIEDNNFKRLMYLNLIILKNYCNLKLYEKAKKLALSQIRTLSCFSTEKILLKKTNYFYVIALIGLEEYSLVDENCFIEPINTTDVALKVLLANKQGKSIDVNDIVPNCDEEAKQIIMKTVDDLHKKKMKDFPIEFCNLI